MTMREYAITQINNLPDAAIVKIVEFISFQRFNLGLYESDDDYLASIPGMTESIMKGMATPLDECLDSVGWDIN